MNFNPMQGNVVFFACNKSNYIAEYCRSIHVNRKGLKDKIKNVKVDEKGKVKVDEIKDPIKKRWVKKSDSKVGSGSPLDSDVGTTFSN